MSRIQHAPLPSVGIALPPTGEAPEPMSSPFRVSVVTGELVADSEPDLGQAPKADADGQDESAKIIYIDFR